MEFSLCEKAKCLARTRGRTEADGLEGELCLLTPRLDCTTVTNTTVPVNMSTCQHGTVTCHISIYVGRGTYTLRTGTSP